MMFSPCWSPRLRFRNVNVFTNLGAVLETAHAMLRPEEYTAVRDRDPLTLPSRFAALRRMGPSLSPMGRGEVMASAPRRGAEKTAISISERSMPTPDHIITSARDWIGTRYQHQASLKQVGCDCLGLIRGVWRDIYEFEPEEMPAYSPDWAEAGGAEALACAARRHIMEIPCADYLPGDVLLFRWKPHLPAKHAGIATSASTMIHAQDGARVSEISLTPWWTKRLAFAFRFPGVQS